MFMDVLRRSLIFLLLWRVDSTSLKGGLTSTASALPGAKQSSIKTAKPHSTIKLAKGDKRETNGRQTVHCWGLLAAQSQKTCYSPEHVTWQLTDMLLLQDTSGQENEVLDVGTCWHTNQFFALCFAWNCRSVVIYTVKTLWEYSPWQ